MSEKMKVHAFRVFHQANSDSLQDLLDTIMNDGIDERVRKVGPSDIRIEHIEYDNGIWLFDFAKFRDDHGPGKATKSTPVVGFHFDADEFFCEETAALYDENKQYMIVQYNHHGVRAGGIEEYLNIYSNNINFGYELQPKYDSSVEAKYNNKYATKKVSFAIAPRFITEADKKAGLSLSSALDIGNDSNANIIEMTLSVGREKNSFLNSTVDNMINLLMRKFVTEPLAVKKLQVNIIENLDSKVEVLDLLEQRLEVSYAIKHGADRRFPRSDRFACLKRALGKWSGSLK